MLGKYIALSLTLIPNNWYVSVVSEYIGFQMGKSQKYILSLIRYKMEISLFLPECKGISFLKDALKEICSFGGYLSLQFPIKLLLLRTLAKTSYLLNHFI